MNEFYPYDSPIIMTDAIFTLYGGSKDYTTTAQRNLAYWMAEQKASEDLNTFLLPTMVTGTYHYRHRIDLEHTYVRSVARIDYIDFKGDAYWTVTGTNNWYVDIWSPDYGRIDVAEFLNYCGCYYPYQNNPYKLRIAYEAGLPTGTATNPDVLLGLTIYSEIILNEITGFGNESPGNASIESFKNQQYFEKRRGLFNTVFGGSPRALFVYNLFSRLRKRKYVGL